MFKFGNWVDLKMLLVDSPPKELSMTVISILFKTVHEKSSLKGVSPANFLFFLAFLIGALELHADIGHRCVMSGSQGIE